MVPSAYLGRSSPLVTHGPAFPPRLRPPLAPPLALFAAEPELARQLTVDPCLGDEADLACQQRWSKRYGALLRHAAAERPETLTHPPFLEPTLIGGITFQISRSVLAGEAAELETLLPGLLEFVLVYYLVPQDASRIAGTPGFHRRRSKP
jgi:hypothetical protein